LNLKNKPLIQNIYKQSKEKLGIGVNPIMEHYNIDITVQSKEKQKPEKLKRTIKDKLEHHVRDKVISEVKMVSKVEKLEISDNNE